MADRSAIKSAPERAGPLRFLSLCPLGGHVIRGRKQGTVYAGGSCPSKTKGTIEWKITTAWIAE